MVSYGYFNNMEHFLRHKFHTHKPLNAHQIGIVYFYPTLCRIALDKTSNKKMEDEMSHRSMGVLNVTNNHNDFILYFVNAIQLYVCLMALF